ncbi:MAG: UDP-N-acetylglucosamine--N-acetylmuramyl-(pentapeptide) pyrophosphoryl-undecaprenol [Myxococcaceae bacterium]|nr:UDP-N-acetylglucosamine--N-acetylmuramyl-(pentapeptide) pyrophosphoryl-undecaprenol [Myxococcaceae bacterium]
MIERVILAGGGTGGHLFPGIAVHEELKRREPELETLFVGTARGIETKVIPQIGERLECLDVGPLKGRTRTQLLKNLLALPQAGYDAAKILRSFRPSLVIGVGGYAAGPMVGAAATLGIPTALLEQNASVGLTNRLLARVVDRAYVSFEETVAAFPKGVAQMVGNPVRRSFVAAGNMARMDPSGFEMRARRVLVIGGSQGARSLNQLVPEALARAVRSDFFAQDPRRQIEIVHQTGHAMLEAVRARYEELGIEATVTPFIDDMPRAYASAALVIGRAGATSLAEICAIGRPSILIPIPTADDHQWPNARALEQRGAAIALREKELTVDQLTEAVSRLLTQPEERRRMAEAARSLGRPDAAAAIVDDLCAWLGCSSSELDSDSHEAGEADGLRAEPSEGNEPSTSAHDSFPPAADQRRARAASSKRRSRRRSVAWGHTDRYYGTRAVGSLE